eukprot:scaffold56852_cov17-Prasinocladus_malaysianus.AAC.1
MCLLKDLDRKKESPGWSGQASLKGFILSHNPCFQGASLILRIIMWGLSRVFECPILCLPGGTLPANPKGLSLAMRSQVVQPGIQRAFSEPPNFNGPGMKEFV